MVRPCFSCHCRHFLLLQDETFFFRSGARAPHPRQFGLIYRLLNFLSENWPRRRCLALFIFPPPFSLPSEGSAVRLKPCGVGGASYIYVFFFIGCLRSSATGGVAAPSRHFETLWTSRRSCDCKRLGWGGGGVRELAGRGGLVTCEEHAESCVLKVTQFVMRPSFHRPRLWLRGSAVAAVSPAALAAVVLFLFFLPCQASRKQR